MKQKIEYPHVPAAFINAIREEGSKKEACDFLQEIWNELQYVRKQYNKDVLRISEDKVSMYDPPAGWQYGFPKVYEPWPGESIEETLLRDGYPQSAIDKYTNMPVRFWES